MDLARSARSHSKIPQRSPFGFRYRYPLEFSGKVADLLLGLRLGIPPTMEGLLRGLDLRRILTISPLLLLKLDQV